MLVHHQRRYIKCKLYNYTIKKKHKKGILILCYPATPILPTLSRFSSRIELNFWLVHMTVISSFVSLRPKRSHCVERKTRNACTKATISAICTISFLSNDSLKSFLKFWLAKAGGHPATLLWPLLLHNMLIYSIDAMCHKLMVLLWLWWWPSARSVDDDANWIQQLFWIR